MKALSTKLKELNACQSGWRDSRRRVIRPAWFDNQIDEAEAAAVAYAASLVRRICGQRLLLDECPRLVRIMVARGLISFPNGTAKGGRA